MARKSGWQQFTENFSSTYDAVNKFGKEGAARDIMDQKVEEQFDETGASTGFNMGGKSYGTMDDINTAKYTQLGDNMVRYGDAEGGLKAQQSLATLRSTQNQNRLDERTLEDKVNKSGLSVNQSQADVDKTVSSTANIDATTNKTVVETGTAIEKEKQAVITTNTAQDVYNTNKPLNDALMVHQQAAGNGEFKDPESAKQALIDIYGQFGDPEGKAAKLISGMRSEEIGGILHSANVISSEFQVMLADPNKGLSSISQWIDDNDGTDAMGAVVKVIDGKHVMAATKTDDKGNVTLMKPYIMEGGSEAELMANMQLYATPGKSIELANQMQNFRKVNSEIGLNNAKAKAEAEGVEQYNKEYIKSVTEYMNNPDSPYNRAKRKNNQAGADKELAAYKAQMFNAHVGTGGIGGGANRPTSTVGGKGWSITPNKGSGLK